MEKYIYCDGAKPGEWEAIALNPNSRMAFGQGFLKAKIEGCKLGSEDEARRLVLVQAFVVFLILVNSVPDILFGAFVTVIG